MPIDPDNPIDDIIVPDDTVDKSSDDYKNKDVPSQDQNHKADDDDDKVDNDDTGFKIDNDASKVNNEPPKKTISDTKPLNLPLKIDTPPPAQPQSTEAKKTTSTPVPSDQDAKNTDKPAANLNLPKNVPSQNPSSSSSSSSSSPLNDDDLLSDYNQIRSDFVELEKRVLDLGERVELHQGYAESLNPFRLLGFYKHLDLKYFDMTPKSKPYYSSPHTGLKKNPSYCDYSDLFNLFNPSNVYDQMSFVTDYDRSNNHIFKKASVFKFFKKKLLALVRTHVIEKIGVDVMPEVSMTMQGYREPRFDLDLEATMFFTKKVDFHFFQEIGKQFLCKCFCNYSP